MSCPKCNKKMAITPTREKCFECGHLKVYKRRLEFYRDTKEKQRNGLNLDKIIKRFERLRTPPTGGESIENLLDLTEDDLELLGYHENVIGIMTTKTF